MLSSIFFFSVCEKPHTCEEEKEEGAKSSERL